VRNAIQHIVVGLGEILWDIFEDAAIFGGAPADCELAQRAQSGQSLPLRSAKLSP
jgi:hypothetical protein